MRVLVQRVKEASVKSGDYYGSVQKGLLLLVGVHELSTESDADALADKIVKSRIFEDDAGKMNLSVQDIAGEILSISQFTLYADVKKVIVQALPKLCSHKKQSRYTIILIHSLKIKD